MLRLTLKKLIKTLSGTVFWGREDYLAEARTQLEDKDVYQKLKGNIEDRLEKIVKRVL